jgi:hypothetical protein
MMWRVAAVAIVVITAGILYLTAERGDTLIADTITLNSHFRTTPY